MATATLNRFTVAEMDVTAGVTVKGCLHAEDCGDWHTPAIPPWVDVNSLRIEGNPAAVAHWFYDSGVDPAEWDEDPARRRVFLEDLAADLLERHNR